MDQNEKAIRKRAYQLWEEHGAPEGRETDFWLQAEREIASSEGNSKPDQEQPDEKGAS